MSHTLETVYTLEDGVVNEFLRTSGYNPDDYDFINSRLVATILINNAGELNERDSKYVLTQKFNEAYTMPLEKLKRITLNTGVPLPPGTNQLQMLRFALNYAEKYRIEPQIYYNAEQLSKILDYPSNYTKSITANLEPKNFEIYGIKKDVDLFLALGNILLYNTTITNLDLNFKYATNDGVITLSNSLVNNTTVKKLDMSHITIELFDILVEGLKYSGMTTLYLPNVFNNNKAFNRSLKYLLKENNTLLNILFGREKFDINSFKLFTDGLATNYSICELGLSYTEFNDTQMKMLNNAIRQRNTPVALGLRGNKLTDDGYYILAGLIRDNLIGSNLNISDSKINFNQLVMIGQALNHNITITYFNATNEGITADDSLTLLEIIKDNTTLEKYYVSEDDRRQDVYRAEQNFVDAREERKRQQAGRYIKPARR